MTAALLALAMLVAACTGATEDAAPEPAPEPPAAPSAPEPPDAPGAAEEPPPVAAPATPHEVVEPPPPPDGRDAVIARTQQLVGQAIRTAEDTPLAVLVTDEYGREIAAHRPDEPMLPASTLKIVTAAAVLATIGPDARFTTGVETTAPIDGDGTLRGDLVLLGGGDPALATDEYGRWVYPARPRTPLAALADDLVAHGLTRLEGDVVGTAPDFTGPARADGWPDRYFSSFDARYASGLTVDAGLRTILTYPEPEDDPDADGSPDLTDPDRDAAPSDDPDGADDEVAPEDLGPPDVRVDHVLDPAAHAAAELVRLLVERDVEVVGEGRSGEVDAPIVGRLASVDSPPMHELLRFAVQRSDNHLTDGLFHAIGRIRTGEGSWERGDRALRQVLERFDIDHRQAVFADGSGLSRDDRVTARLLVDLDRAMYAGRHAATWDSLMAVMGESGTLRERLRGTVAAGRVRGKTGTLRDVTSLSGSVHDDTGVRYHFVVIANEADGPGRWVARSLMDELALQLSADVAGCDVTPGEPPEADGEIPRATIRC